MILGHHEPQARLKVNLDTWASVSWASCENPSDEYRESSGSRARHSRSGQELSGFLAFL